MKPIISLITDDWIKENNPCREAVVDWWDKKERDPIKILGLLIKDNKLRWANWFIVRIMEYKDYVSYAVFAAEQVLSIFEKKYPNDQRPREAIKAAKKCIKNPSEENKRAAWSAGWSAWSAAKSAACSAGSAWSAAESAAWSAKSAACSAALAAWSAELAMRVKILNYGLKILNYGMKLLTQCSDK